MRADEGREDQDKDIIVIEISKNGEVIVPRTAEMARICSLLGDEYAKLACEQSVMKHSVFGRKMCG